MADPLVSASWARPSRGPNSFIFMQFSAKTVGVGAPQENPGSTTSLSIGTVDSHGSSPYNNLTMHKYNIM